MRTNELFEESRNYDAPPCRPGRLLLIAALALGSGMATNRWLYATANQNFAGRIQVEMLTVRAPVDGILQEWNVKEGETVDPNVLLCRIGGQDLVRKRDLQQQEVERLTARTKTLQAEVDVKLHEHLRTVESDIYQVELQTADLLQKRYFHELELMAWRDQREVLATQAATPAPRKGTTQTETAEEREEKLINFMLKEESAVNAIEATDAQLEICSARLATLNQQKQEMQERVRQAVGLSEIELQLEQSKAGLERLEIELSQQLIHSAALGTIANVRRKAGEYVKAGEVLAELYLMQQPYAVAEIPTSHSHRFEVEMPVRCQFPNGEVRTGVVTQVAVSATTTTRPDEKPTVPLKIEQTGALWPKLPIGGEITVIR
ncbi:MAG: HlyD family efflux transporter periplasmic adaptor subunit [Planctomycetaceae bacterium]|nr:HlyD family efflux transporter periplasmic adaptor subunit [Planctomycetaceae bacterium]